MWITNQVMHFLIHKLSTVENSIVSRDFHLSTEFTGPTTITILFINYNIYIRPSKGFHCSTIKQNNYVILKLNITLIKGELIE